MSRTNFRNRVLMVIAVALVVGLGLIARASLSPAPARGAPAAQRPALPVPRHARPGADHDRGGRDAATRIAATSTPGAGDREDPRAGEAVPGAPARELCTERDDGYTHIGARVGGERDGVWKTYNHLGTLCIEASYEGGRLHGVQTLWGPGGALRHQARYEEGELHGEFVRWHPNGQKAAVLRYERGVRNGAWTEWYPDGTTKLEAAYSEDATEGRCVFYRLDGSIDPLRSGTYRAGRRIDELH